MYIRSLPINNFNDRRLQSLIKNIRTDRQIVLGTNQESEYNKTCLQKPTTNNALECSRCIREQSLLLLYFTFGLSVIKDIICVVHQWMHEPN